VAENSLVLTVGQQAALQVAFKTADAQLPQAAVGVICGFAGTGKTTMLKVVAEEIGPPLFLTPTGKAALRLQEATGFTASTIHRWMYRAVEDPKTGRVDFGPKPLEELERPSNRLIAVDEASMLSEPLWLDLVKTATRLKCNILLIGDPFQLPPVDPEATNPFCCLDASFAATYRANLTEIVRQALDNPIIKASMYIRNGDMNSARSLLPNLERMEAWKLTLDICDKKDGVIICHKNVTRHKVNASVRTELGLSKSLVSGEPLLILKNCYEANVYNGEVLPFAGWTWESDSVDVTDKYRKVTQRTRFGATTFNNTKVLLAHERIRGNMEAVSFSAIAYNGVRTYSGDKPAESVYRGYGKKKKRGPQHPFLDANFGYCLTGHKSQGSEWDRVLVIAEPSIRIDTRDGLRWAYTALTRAKEKAFFYWPRA